MRPVTTISLHNSLQINLNWMHSNLVNDQCTHTWVRPNLKPTLQLSVCFWRSLLFYFMFCIHCGDFMIRVSVWSGQDDLLGIVWLLSSLRRGVVVSCKWVINPCFLCVYVTHMNSNAQAPKGLHHKSSPVLWERLTLMQVLSAGSSLWPTWGGPFVTVSCTVAFGCCSCLLAC